MHSTTIRPTFVNKPAGVRIAHHGGRFLRDHDPNDFDDNRGGGRLPADADDGVPATSDDSVRAHVKRGMNHLEAAMDDDEVDMDRVAAARDCLSCAIERKSGMGNRVGVKFTK